MTGPIIENSGFFFSNNNKALNHLTKIFFFLGEMVRLEQVERKKIKVHVLPKTSTSSASVLASTLDMELLPSAGKLQSNADANFCLNFYTFWVGFFSLSQPAT